ncbi:unnamed protein product [Lepeophtheirus salmonis]|uniref:(salmon louse) hypothetical protein n=1 Tax=Lepeophtheirus salmonis TaxID=72036 RepID=A0A7R8H1F9_LEPSM|nr:unnamed protein product [Lepeophtheirus salmonis]CAF2808805.1 unnamed protein product [Lepeophtheirus salmonis]
MESACLRSLVFGVLLGLTYGQTLQASCVTPECKETAQNIRNNLNQSVDPCEDFYEFSCGGWISKQNGNDNYTSTFYDAYHFIMDKVLKIAKEPINSNSSHPLQQAKIYFKSCQNVYSYDEYAKLGGYPLFQSEWTPANFTNTLKWISERISSLTNKSHQTGKKHPLKYWAVSISGLPSLDLQTYMRPKENKEVIQTYKDTIYNSTKSLCSYFQLGFNETRVQKDIEGLFEFETLLVKWMFLRDKDISDSPSYGYKISLIMGKMEMNMTGIYHLLNNTSMRTLSNFFMWTNFVAPALHMDS